MDAHSLLKRQGWRGLGHSLHASDDSIGLKRPILFSQKQNVFGIGTDQHKSNDQWWLNAFDQGLRNMSVAADGKCIRNTATTATQLQRIQGRPSQYGSSGGLYASFVRGGVMEGTIGTESGTSSSAEESEKDQETPATSVEPEPRSKRREKGTKEERRVEKEAKRKRREEKAERKRLRAEKRERKQREVENKVEHAKKLKGNDTPKQKEKLIKEERTSKETKEERRERKLAKRLEREKGVKVFNG